ncbi:MAG: hypothetical protein M1833_007140 [Piccolia ochrophora]|nr:MAG: hypothetical protein M1833_007140 [Piccolia ochrophora]
MASGTTSLNDTPTVSSLNMNLTYADMNLFDLSPADFGQEFGSDAPLFDAAFASPHFTSVNDPITAAPTTNLATVSPKDLMRDPQASAPPSTAFTNLTSPSIFDSPDVADSFETSPMFNNVDGELPTENWYSLFPGTSGESDESPPNHAIDVYDQATFAHQVDNHRRSSSGHSPQTARTSGKHSSVSGVSSRKRDKPLPPIQVDDGSDTIAMKRARNTMAARKSRQKKVERFDELEKTIEELRDEVAHWKSLAMHQDLGPS